MTTPKDPVDKHKEPPSQGSQVVYFVCSLPAWWLCLRALEAALLRSREPDWIGLYSGKKIGLVLVCAALAFFWFRLSSRLAQNTTIISTMRKLGEHCMVVFLFPALASFACHATEGMFVGEDIGGQVKSSLQWHSGESRAPNFLTHPNWRDLSQNESNWILRPPGASWLAIPGLMVGLTLGSALRLSLLLCMMAGGIGWIAFARRLGLKKPGISLIALSLGLCVGPATAYFSTTNVALYALAPWLMIFALKVGNLISSKESRPTRVVAWILAFHLTLGSLAWIKLSGMILAISIVSYPIFRLLLLKPGKAQVTKWLILYLCLGFLFWVPYLGLESVNESRSGITASQMYGENDSDLQAPLFGKHHTRSTKGLFLAWNTLAAPGYSLPAKQFGHGFRDLMKQFQSVRSWLDRNKLNEHCLFVGLVGFALSILLVRVTLNGWGFMSSEGRLILAVFFVLPFLGLSILSHRYGFNYLLYHAHTIEYATLFSLPAIVALSSSRIGSKISSQLLAGICLAIPITSQAEDLARLPFRGDLKPSSQTEKALGMEGREFSEAIGVIEKDSAHSSDVLLFLPEGDMGDLVIRTRLRCLAIHFAGGNLTKYAPLRSSRPITVYCAYSSSLEGNLTFKNALKNCFPDEVETIQIPCPNSEDVTVWKISLAPHAVN